MKSRRWIVLALVVVAFWTVACWQGRGAEDATQPSTAATKPGADANQFEGKLLIVRTDRALDEKGAYLQKVHVQTIGSETFLVGQGIALNPKWKGYEGQTIWVSVHHIEQMYEFDSLDDINKMYEKSDE
jgi:hypothetical protein